MNREMLDDGGKDFVDDSIFTLLGWVSGFSCLTLPCTPTDEEKNEFVRMEKIDCRERLQWF